MYDYTQAKMNDDAMFDIQSKRLHTPPRPPLCVIPIWI